MPFIVQDINLIVTHDSRWPKEPLSVEKLCADPHYRQWAIKSYDRGDLTRYLIDTWRKEGHRETRKEMFKAIAKLLGVGRWETIKNAADRSSKVIPKRRRQI
jgi:hypothetical protein